MHYDGFHLVNRLLHVLITLMVFHCLRLLITSSPKIALFSALVFAVHPIQTEAITYVNGRPDALAMLFVVAAWFFFCGCAPVSNPQASTCGYRWAFIFSAFFQKRTPSPFWVSPS
ncbi:MAG: hypothetical protein WBN92_07740 [Terriglobia bacterium]